MIYITIPVHDEESTVGVLLWKIRNVMGEFGRDYEILVCDDASTDGTRPWGPSVVKVVATP